MLLELAELAAHLGAHVAEDGARHHHREDPGVRHDGVASGEEQERPRQTHDVLEAVGYGAAPTQEARQREAKDEARDRAEPQAQQKTLETGGDRRVGPDHHLQRNGGDDGADRIDQNAFRLEHGVETGAHRGVAKERPDHRRARHDDQVPKMIDSSQVHPIKRWVATAAPTAVTTAPMVTRLRIGPPSRRSRAISRFKPALEEDDGDPELHDPEQALPERARVEPVEHIGADDHADRE